MKILKENYGNIYYTFDDPICAKDFYAGKLDRNVHNKAPLHLQELTAYEKSLLPSLAHEIVHRQQKSTVITVFNMMAVALNYNLTIGQVLTLETLTEEVIWLKNVLEDFGGCVQFENLENSIADALIVHGNLVRLSSEGEIILVSITVNQGDINQKILKAHALSDAVMTEAVPFVMLQIYINPVLQYLIDGAILVTILSKRLRLNKGEFPSKSLTLYFITYFICLNFQKNYLFKCFYCGLNRVL